MARPAKSTKLTRKHLTEEEKEAKEKAEEQLRGNGDNLTPQAYLTERQKEIFENIVAEMKAAGVLGNLDTFVLSQAAVTIDRMQSMEQQINENPLLLENGTFISTKDKYTKDFFRCCNELSLSPQSRAKIGNIAMNNQKEQADPLLAILGGD